MASSVSRRMLIGAGGAVALAPIIVEGRIAQAAPATVQTGPVYALVDPVRVFD